MIHLPKLASSLARLSRVQFLATGDADLIDEVRDGLAYSIQELAEAYGVDERGVEAIRAILEKSEGDAQSYDAAHDGVQIRAEGP